MSARRDYERGEHRRDSLLVPSRVVAAVLPAHPERGYWAELSLRSRVSARTIRAWRNGAKYASLNHAEAVLFALDRTLPRDAELVSWGAWSGGRTRVVAPRVLELLRERGPQRCRELEPDLPCHPTYVRVVLNRMLKRGEVVRTRPAGKTHPVVWSLPNQRALAALRLRGILEER